MWLYSFADFERGMGYNAKAPFEHGVQRTKLLLSRLGDPQNGMPIVHIAGSKGKGSVCALVAAAGEKFGLPADRIIYLGEDPVGG